MFQLLPRSRSRSPRVSKSKVSKNRTNILLWSYDLLLSYLSTKQRLQGLSQGCQKLSPTQSFFCFGFIYFLFVIYYVRIYLFILFFDPLYIWLFVSDFICFSRVKWIVNMIWLQNLLVIHLLHIYELSSINQACCLYTFHRKSK